MAGLPQIRGMLLEEAVLYLLRSSGYVTIDDPRDDPTLQRGHAGLEVIGRGSVHQIDAIADYTVAHPFSHPQRLLVEAKFKKGKVGIEVLRNAVGVVKDVGEYWVTSTRNPALNASVNGAERGIKNRYHYQYAVFSATGYTPMAESYAFAQDIYLIPLAQSKFIQPIIDAIDQLGPNVSRIKMPDLRSAIRESLRFREIWPLRERFPQAALEQLEQVINQTQRVNQAILGMLANQFPVFLVRNPEINLENLEPIQPVRIFWDGGGWYLRDARTARLLFSFDLPLTLFNRYADEGILTATRAIDLKVDFLRNIQAIVTIDDTPRVINFRLDEDWIQQIRTRMRRDQ